MSHHHHNNSSMNSVVAQLTEEARLDAVFERTNNPSHRSIIGTSSGHEPSHQRTSSSADESIPAEQQISAYLSKMQRGGHIQSFGCMLAVIEPSFRVIAYSENAPDLLDLKPGILTIATDFRTLFAPSSSALLESAFRSREITLLNPLWVHPKNSWKSFYAIMHRIDIGIVIDLEPVRTVEPALSLVGAVHSQKLAVKAISYLQSLPGGDIKLLCDAVVRQVRELTSYDRVMVYKFHEDDHGEVLAESKREDLEPYIGLHYPSTDVPQASRFLFKHNRVRMIADCHATPVRVIQHEGLKEPLCLGGSTLRAPHACHAQYMENMGSIASLTLAVIINENHKDDVSGARNSMRLWGLVVGHHTTDRRLPFPLRSACEFLMQAFGLQLNMELQLAAQLSEKRVLKMQTLLCDMLLRGSPTGIVTQSPSIMDLVKCDGAALYYHGRYYSLGVTPTEPLIKDIVQWMLDFHGDSTGLSTDSLADAGFHGAAALGDAVCGMAVAYITSGDFIFWFRSNTAKEIKWGGAKHHPRDKDDGLNINPRNSFQTFLEVVKGRSLPWENAEMDVIHSLQLILRDSFRDRAGEDPMTENLELINRMNKLKCETREMKRLIQTASVPIFTVGVQGLVNGWNAKVAELIGLPVEEAMRKSLVHDLVHSDSEEIASELLSHALKGEDKNNVELKLRTFGAQTSKNVVFLVVSACSSKDHTNKVFGVCFVGQDVTDQKVVMDKFIKIQGDYKAIMHSPSLLIPPIFASDDNMCCYEWNAAMENLTGYGRVEVIGKMLNGEIFGSFCRLNGEDVVTKFMIVLHNAIAGKETEKFPFSFFDRSGKYVQVFMNAHKRVNMEGEIIGVFCFLQMSSEMESRLPTMKELAYVVQQVKNPLNGIRFTNSILETAGLTEHHNQLLQTSAACEKQMSKIMKDADLGNIENGPLELEKAEFILGSVIDAVVSQVMLPLREKGVKLIHDIPEEVKTLTVYGDQARTQQILVDFLLIMVRHVPSPNGWVKLQLIPSLNHVSEGLTIVHIEFRIVCPVEGLPSALVQDLLDNSRCATQEGLGLSTCKNILRLMNGQVEYMKEPQGCYFRIVVDLPMP